MPRPHPHPHPVLAKLHWLPIAQRIDYKISSLCYDVFSDTALLYLSDLLRLCVPTRSLRSSADTRIFRIPKRKKSPGSACFLPSRPCHLDWNKLPYSVRHAQTQSQFKHHLKTTLFRSIYETRLSELLCVFSCSPYFSPCETACDLHLYVS